MLISRKSIIKLNNVDMQILSNKIDIIITIIIQLLYTYIL